MVRAAQRAEASIHQTSQAQSRDRKEARKAEGVAVITAEPVQQQADQRTRHNAAKRLCINNIVF